MKTGMRALQGSGRKTVRPVRSALTAMTCVGLFVAVQAMAQEAAESGAAAHAATVPMSSGPMQMTISMGPPAAGGAKAAPSGPLRGPNCSGPVRGEQSVIVPLGKSVLVPLDEPVRNRTLGNPAIAQATMVSPQTLYVLGEAVGTTNMIVQGRSGACQVIDVVVNADAGGLQASLQQLMPGEHDIRVSTAADNLVLMGHVSSAQAAQQAAQIAAVYSVSHGASGGAGGSGKSGVLNMLTVDSPEQVMLEVKVAEVDKTLIDQLGAAINIQGGFGSWTGSLVTSLLAGVSSTIGISKANNKPFNVNIDAQKTDNLVKILAEPNLVTISGQEATFLAGGEIFIPIPQSSGNGVTAITLQEQEFGVGLKFTPTVLGNGRINLKVSPEVSELSPTGVTLSASNVSGTSILPLITTRRASTTVQMRDGESFAIGGLISNNVTGSLKALPGIGELPILGTLFRSTSFQQDRSELVFIVTPHLVHPMPANQYRSPTESFTQPNEVDIYATGDMEGRGAARKQQAQSAGAAPASPAAPSAPAPAAPAAPQGQPLSGPAAPAAPAAPTAPVLSRTVPTTEQDAVMASAAPAPEVTSAPLPPTQSNAERIELAARRIAADSGQVPPSMDPADAPSATATNAGGPAHVAYVARVELTSKQSDAVPATGASANH
jgi:pilus assembly protein CpaC